MPLNLWSFLVGLKASRSSQTFSEAGFGHRLPPSNPSHLPTCPPPPVAAVFCIMKSLTMLLFSLLEPVVTSPHFKDKQCFSPHVFPLPSAPKHLLAAVKHHLLLLLPPCSCSSASSPHVKPEPRPAPAWNHQLWGADNGNHCTDLQHDQEAWTYLWTNKHTATQHTLPSLSFTSRVPHQKLKPPQNLQKIWTDHQPWPIKLLI